MTDDHHALNSDAAPDEAPGLGVLDEQGRIVAANQAYRDWFVRHGSADLLAERLRQFAEDAPAVELPLQSDATVRLDRLDGRGGQLTLVTVRRRTATPSPTFDALTRLPDRRAVADRIAAWRRAAAPAVPRFTVLFLDLDAFKSVNDRHGHAVGDAVLQALAARWVGCVRDGDVVARYGGDEFVVLVQLATTAAEVEPVIRRLQDATRRPVVVGDLSLELAATVGWAAAIDANAQAGVDALIAAADRDMYARKGRVLR